MTYKIVWKFTNNPFLPYIADVKLTIPAPKLSSTLEVIPGVSTAKAVASGVGGAVTGAASNAAAVGNKVADASHDQLKAFGERQSQNMGIATAGIHDGWMDFHHGFDDQFKQVGDNMKR